MTLPGTTARVRRRRGVAAGLVLGALYLAVAAVSFGRGLLPGAPVLDGLSPPPPYQWVSPPPARVKDNVPASAGTQSVPLTSAGAAGSVTTPDGQCQLLFDSSSVPPLPGQTSVSVTMVPSDPARVGSPPTGFSYDSNAYTITAAYEPSGQAITKLSATLVLTYATDATEITQWTGSSWLSINSTPAGRQQLFGPITSLGIFSTAVLGTSPAPLPTPSQQSSTTLVIEIAAIFGVVIALTVAVILRARAGRSSGGSAPRGPTRPPPPRGGPPRGGPPRR